MPPPFASVLRLADKLRQCTGGQTAVLFALLLVPLMAAGAGGIEFAICESAKSAMQDSIDGAALNLAKKGPSLASNQYQPTAQSFFDATFNSANPSGRTITANYDTTTATATVTGTATYNTMLLKIVGIPTITLTATATAQTSSKWPVCVDITSPLGKHTLLTSGTATINFSTCMVQVNTSDWDAVEARSTSSIASTNGDNCFVGDIHYGNVTPAKDPTCTMFSDPFAGYAMPASAGTCNYTNFAAAVGGQTLSPGTYCGGLTISANATLSPGVYILKNGGLSISGATVTGNGVTFIFTGNQISGATKTGATTSTAGGGFMIQGASVVNLTADTSASAGQFAGFVFYMDPASSASCSEVGDGAQLSTTPKNGTCVSVVQDTSKVTLSGITYLVGGELLVGDSGKLAITDGSLMSDFLAAISTAQVTLTSDGTAATSSQIAMTKQGKSAALVLVR